MLNHLANLVLIIHALFVVFVVGGLAAIWIGHWRNKSWVANQLFRRLHLAAIAFVAITAVAGVACPLTILEDRLRYGAVASQGFIERWIGGLIYYQAPTWVFTAIYVLFAAVVVITWRLVPPRR